jgi:hypothetical protein
MSADRSRFGQSKTPGIGGMQQRVLLNSLMHSSDLASRLLDYQAKCMGPLASTIATKSFALQFFGMTGGVTQNVFG